MTDFFNLHDAAYGESAVKKSKVGHFTNERDERVSTDPALIQEFTSSMLETDAQNSNLPKKESIDNLPDAVWIKDIRFKFLLVNDSFLKIFRKRLEEVINKTDFDICSEKSARQTLRTDMDVVNSSARVRLEREFVESKGKRLFLDVIKWPRYDEAGRCTGIVGMARNITKQRCLQIKTLRHEQKLKEQSKRLKDLHTTLQVVMENQEQNKRNVEQNVILNVKDVLIPCIEKLKSHKLSSDTREVVDLIEANIRNIASSFTHDLTSKYYDLTNKEILVANLIKEGRSTKEIANILNISRSTVIFHRNKIRNKLNLTNKKINLKNFLRSL